nr:hypothetical protein [Tanacetum cinerariifolium]
MSCDAFYWIDPELNNGWYKNQIIELYLALNPNESHCHPFIHNPPKFSKDDTDYLTQINIELENINNYSSSSKTSKALSAVDPIPFASNLNLFSFIIAR